ncbi:tetratricopeptide repeat protein [Altererythrobacter sp.]|uniref:tetratricopeptide repeat protein n=1 Tax=Altererythrobacter sp. TaxID=1872480 RepID=UPI003D0A6441
MHKHLAILGAFFLLQPECSNAQPKDDLIAALEQLSTEGNAEATYHLGMAYHTGSGTSVDRVKALAMFREAAEAGNPLASYKLGCYYDGQGGGLVEDDLALALEYKLVAAEAGYALAQQDVAALFAQSGQMDKAVAWLERAVGQGWPQALATYASIHNGAEGIAPDPVKTDAYFRLFLQRQGGNSKQVEWLREFELGMSENEKSRADDIVKRYRPAPTQITLDALSGQGAAMELIERER